MGMINIMGLQLTSGLTHAGCRHNTEAPALPGAHKPGGIAAGGLACAVQSVQDQPHPPGSCCSCRRSAAPDSPLVISIGQGVLQTSLSDLLGLPGKVTRLHTRKDCFMQFVRDKPNLAHEAASLTGMGTAS